MCVFAVDETKLIKRLEEEEEEEEGWDHNIIKVKSTVTQ